MNKETWENCTKDEKKSLLIHWFNYYGGIIMELNDLENFGNLIEEKQDELFDHIVTNCIFRDTIQTNLLVQCMRNNKLDELFGCNIKYEDVPDILKEKYNIMRNKLFLEIEGSFNKKTESIKKPVRVKKFQK